MQRKEEVTVRFQATQGNEIAGGLRRAHDPPGIWVELGEFYKLQFIARRNSSANWSLGRTWATFFAEFLAGFEANHGAGGDDDFPVGLFGLRPIFCGVIRTVKVPKLRRVTSWPLANEVKGSQGGLDHSGNFFLGGIFQLVGHMDDDVAFVTVAMDVRDGTAIMNGRDQEINPEAVRKCNFASGQGVAAPWVQTNGIGGGGDLRARAFGRAKP